MLDVLVLVTDRLVALLKAGQERDRKLYDDFLVEFSSSMELLHQNYLETFSRYRDAVQAEASPWNERHPLIGEIEKDMLFTDQLRAKVRSLSDYKDDPVFGGVAKAAEGYLLGGPTSAHVLVNGRRLMNAARGATIVGLKEIFSQPITDAEKTQAAVALLDRVVSDLQLQYGAFVRTFAGTKRALLDRRL